MKNGKLVKAIGYTLLAVSCILFLLILIVPWFDISKKQMAIITTSLIVAGEILFYTSVFLIGKSFIEKLWQKLAFWKKTPHDAISKDEVET
ncbi:MAG: transporter suffix domain-containing protein [Salinivirgaceae bacterium]|jgi:hypothetical protein